MFETICHINFLWNRKPDPLNILKKFVDELIILKNNGLNYKDSNIKIQLECFICDAPARAFIKQTVGHTHKQGCEKCNVVGVYENHRVHFANSLLLSTTLR